MPEFTGWMNTDARLVICPHCKARPGEPCRYPSGRGMHGGTHSKRVEVLVDGYGLDPWIGWSGKSVREPRPLAKE